MAGAEPQPETVSTPDSRARLPKTWRKGSPSLAVPQPAAAAAPQTADPARTAEKPAEITSPRASVDRTAATGTEVAKARKEHAEGRTGEAVERLRQLLLYLDEVPGKTGSPIYPAITFAPLSALVEFVEAADGSASDAWSATEVAQWMERREGIAETADPQQET